MCRWIAYNGEPIYMDALIVRPSHSLIVQSLSAKMHYDVDGGNLPTNGDGFGMGWYGETLEPGLFKVTDPAWSNENIRELCAHIKSPLFMAHIRAASTGGIQRTNTHPFKYKNWLLQHNGRVEHFEAIRRDLQFDIAPEFYPLLKGTTDSETFFLLALTYGLEENPKKAMESVIARVKHACREKNVPLFLTMSCAISGGKTLYTLRYAGGAKSNSQYYSTHPDCMKEDDEKNYPRVPAGGVVVVSEPLAQSGTHWVEMPEYSFAAIKGGEVKIMPLDHH